MARIIQSPYLTLWSLMKKKTGHFQKTTCHTLGLSQTLQAEYTSTHHPPISWKKISVQKGHKEAPYILSQEDRRFLTNNTEKLVKRLDTLLLELYLHKLRGKVLPPFITLFDITKVLQVDVPQARSHAKLLLENLEGRVRKEVLPSASEITNETQDPAFLQYKFKRNSLFHRINRSQRSMFYNYFMYEGMQFGQNVVLDFSFLKRMENRELFRLGTDVLESVLLNRGNRRPFHLHFSNLCPYDHMCSILKWHNPQLFDNIPLSTTSKSYLDMFPSNRIVYLTPDGENILKYNPEDVYIIPVVYASKAKGLTQLIDANIRQACLPWYDDRGKWYNVAKILQTLHDAKINNRVPQMKKRSVFRRGRTPPAFPVKLSDMFDIKPSFQER